MLPTSEKRPNVLVIMTDDVGYGDFSCYGAKRVHTPNIDRLAANGVRFTDAHACASTSTPSRYGFLTGEYPFRRPGHRRGRRQRRHGHPPRTVHPGRSFQSAG